MHQSDFCSSRYEGLNGQRSTSANCKIWLWRMRFPCSSLFYLFLLSITEIYGCYLFNATGITSFRSLELPLCTKHRLKVKSVNQLQLPPFCIFHPKMPSKHKTKNIKAFNTQNICKTLGKYVWNYQILWLHHDTLSIENGEFLVLVPFNKKKIHPKPQHLIFTKTPQKDPQFLPW